MRMPPARTRLALLGRVEISMRSLARVRPLLSLEVPADQQDGFHDASTDGEHRLDEVLIRRLATASSGRPSSVAWRLGSFASGLEASARRSAGGGARGPHDVV